jgi:hypothetical protein
MLCSFYWLVLMLCSVYWLEFMLCSVYWLVLMLCSIYRLVSWVKKGLELYFHKKANCYYFAPFLNQIL